MLEGEGAFSDGAREVALTRMVLYRVQAGPDRAAKALDAWP